MQDCRRRLRSSSSSGSRYRGLRTQQSALATHHGLYYHGDLAEARNTLTDAWACFLAHFYLGENEQAFKWLMRVIEERETPFFPMLRHSPIFDNIRNDSQFVAAMARLAEIEAQGTPLKSVAYP